MSKSIVIAERDNIAAVLENGRVAEFFIHRGDVLLGDVYLASVQNILPSIDAAFVNVGSDKMGFLHASDVSGKGALKDKLTPNQKVMVQVVKEPTGHKGPRVTTAISLPGRFLVLMPDEKGINISRKIASAKERGRLKSIVSLLKPAGVGVIIRTEAENQSESEIQEDLEFLLEKWNNIVASADTVDAPNLISRDQDLLYRVIREACNDNIEEIILDTPFALHRTNQLIQTWNLGKDIKVSVHKGTDPLLSAKGIDKEIRTALNTKVNLPSGGYLFIQQTEALTVIDVNSGKFTSSATQGETIRKTNLEAVQEISRQLRLRNIGGMIIIDFIDMDNRVDKLCILEALELALEPDKAKPQVGQLSDLGLVELTRHRQGQSLAEIFTKKCPACNGSGAVIEEFNFLASPQEGELKAKATKFKLPQLPQKPQQKQQGRHGGKPMRPPQERAIETSPALTAAAEQTQPTNKEEQFELSEERLNEFLSTKGRVPSISNIVKVASLDPTIVEKHMAKDFNKDVFTKIQEIESEVPAEQVQKPVEPQQTHQRPQFQHRKPHHHQRQPQMHNRQQPQRQQQPQLQPQQQQPQQLHAKPAEVNQQEIKVQKQPEQQPAQVERQPAMEAKQLVKRTARRTTKSTGSTNTTAKRVTRTRKTTKKTDEE